MRKRCQHCSSDDGPVALPEVRIFDLVMGHIDCDNCGVEHKLDRIKLATALQTVADIQAEHEKKIQELTGEVVKGMKEIISSADKMNETLEFIAKQEPVDGDPYQGL